jgi:hypothetical protein
MKLQNLSLRAGAGPCDKHIKKLLNSKMELPYSKVGAAEQSQTYPINLSTLVGAQRSQQAAGAATATR